MSLPSAGAYGLSQVTQLVSDILRRSTFPLQGPELAGKHDHPALFPREGVYHRTRCGGKATIEEKDATRDMPLGGGHWSEPSR